MFQPSAMIVKYSTALATINVRQEGKGTALRNNVCPVIDLLYFCLFLTLIQPHWRVFDHEDVI